MEMEGTRVRMSKEDLVRWYQDMQSFCLCQVDAKMQNKLGWKSSLLAPVLGMKMTIKTMCIFVRCRIFVSSVVLGCVLAVLF